MLERYAGDLQTRARSWTDLSDDARKRRAALACQQLEAAELWGLVEAYLATYGEAGAQVSKHTLRAYKTGLNELLSYARERGVTLMRPGRDMGASYIRGLEAAGKSASTVRVRQAAAKLLYRALRWAGVCDVAPFEDAKPAKDKTAPWDKRFPYGNEEVTRLLGVCEESCDRLLVLLCAHAGLRVGEATALKHEDISLSVRRLLVQKGKGRKRRTAPVSKSLLLELSHVVDPEGFVLPYRSSERARQRLRRLCLRASVDYKAVHSLRHTCGTRMLQEGLSLEDAARMLGHVTLETTRVYQHWASDALDETVSDW